MKIAKSEKRKAKMRTTIIMTMGITTIMKIAKWRNGEMAKKVFTIKKKFL